MIKKWKWGVTGYQLSRKTHSEIIELCLYAGIASVEANAEFVDGKKPDELKAACEHYHAAGICLDSFHLPMGGEDDVAAFYETVRRRAEARASELMEKAMLLGVRAVIMHPSTNRYSVETEGLDRYLSSLGKSLETLLPHAEELGLTIAMENMLPGEGGLRLGAAPRHFNLFEEKFAHPALGFCLDTGHAQVTGGADGPGQFIDAMGGRLAAVHLQDNAGDRDSHLAPGRGLVNWKSVFEGMAAVGYKHPACIEAPPFDYGPAQSYSNEAWRIMIGRTGTLAENSLRGQG